MQEKCLPNTRKLPKDWIHKVSFLHLKKMSYSSGEGCTAGQTSTVGEMEQEPRQRIDQHKKSYWCAFGGKNNMDIFCNLENRGFF